MFTKKRRGTWAFQVKVSISGKNRQQSIWVCAHDSPGGEENEHLL
jgi:hypothetical protein